MLRFQIFIKVASTIKKKKAVLNITVTNIHTLSLERMALIHLHNKEIYFDKMFLRRVLCILEDTGICTSKYWDFQPSLYLSWEECWTPHLKDQRLQEVQCPIDSVWARDIKHVKCSHQCCQGCGAVLKLGYLLFLYIQSKLTWIHIEGIFNFQHWCHHLHLKKKRIFQMMSQHHIGWTEL